MIEYRTWGIVRNVFDLIRWRAVFVGGKRAKPVIMFGVDFLSTHGRILYRSCVRQRGVMYSSRLRVDR